MKRNNRQNYRVKALDDVFSTLKDAFNEYGTKELKIDSETFHDHDGWGLIFPAILKLKKPAPATSNYKVDYCTAVLAAKFYEQNMIDGQDVTFARPARIILSRLNNLRGNYTTILRVEAHMASRFDSAFFTNYLNDLREDFQGSGFFGMEIFETVAKPYATNFADLFGFNSLKAYVARLISLTIFILAALFGPRDYRNDIFEASTDRHKAMVKEIFDTVERAYAQSMRSAAQPSIEYVLERITYSGTVSDERNYLVCMASVSTGVKPTDIPATFNLNGTSVILFGSFPNLVRANGQLSIPVQAHRPDVIEDMRMYLNGDGWVLEDLGSDGGAMVVHRDGTREFLHKGPKTGTAGPLPLNNGDIICLSPDPKTGHARPEGHNYVFRYATPSWTVS